MGKYPKESVNIATKYHEQNNFFHGYQSFLFECLCFVSLDAFYGLTENMVFFSISKSFKGATFLGNVIPLPVSEQHTNLAL